jgi:hypothetical protein
MSPQFLKAMIAETTPIQKNCEQGADGTSFEEKAFVNALFRVEFYQRKPNHTCVMELKLSPPMD